MVLTLGAKATFAAPPVRHQCVAGESPHSASAAAGLSIANDTTTNNNSNSQFKQVTRNTSSFSSPSPQPPVMTSKVSRLLENLNCLTSRNTESVRQESGNLRPSSPPEGPTKKDKSKELEKPSPSDVMSWNESFDNLLKSKTGCVVFQDFLKQEFSDENLLFWLACQDLKQEKNKDAVEERARMIYEDFISVLSPKEVSLDARVRDQVNRAMVEPRATIFDEAQLQVYQLMKRDSYPRFISSPVYKNLMQDAGKGSSSVSRSGNAADSVTT